MDLQHIFYLTTIVMEFLTIFLLAALVVFVFYIMKKIGQLSDNVNRKIESVGRIVDDPGNVAMEIGAAIAATSIQRLKKFFGR